MQKSKMEKLHKLDAAKSQLDTAIDLFFSKGDPCSIITLAAASEEILGNYVDGEWVKNNENNMFCLMYKQTIERGLEFKNKTEFSQKFINVTKNALKHANNCEEKYISVNGDEVVTRILLSLVNYQIGSGKEFTEKMDRFENWVRENKSEFLGE